MHVPHVDMLHHSCEREQLKLVSVMHVQRCYFGAFLHFLAISLTNLVL